MFLKHNLFRCSVEGVSLKFKSSFLVIEKISVHYNMTGVSGKGNTLFSTSFKEEENRFSIPCLVSHRTYQIYNIWKSPWVTLKFISG